LKETLPFSPCGSVALLALKAEADQGRLLPG
jgi:hypothetical protein